MGRSIQFDREAMRFEAETPYGHREDHYLLVHQIGSGNVLDSDGRIKKSWNYCTVGNETEVIADLARAAGDIESGMLRYQNGATRIENYIKNWRETIHDSITIDQFNEEFAYADLIIYQPDSVTDLPEAVRETFKLVKGTWRRTTPESSNTPEYKANVCIESLQMFNTMARETNVGMDIKKPSFLRDY